jgi:hypothetical protein
MIALALGAAAVLCGLVVGNASARASYRAFSNPPLAAQRLSVSARTVDKVHLFRPCAVINPYLIRCGGYVAGVKPLTASGKLRVRIDWRKVNPYMLEKTVYALGGVFQHGFVDTRTAY